MRHMGARLVTAAELPFQLCEYRNELVRGEVRQMTRPGFLHGEVARRLALLVGNHVEQRGLGVYMASEIGFLIERDPDTVRGPDGAFLSNARLAAIGCPAGYVDGPPDLAVEIVSPTDRLTKVREKARMWVGAGARMAVVLDPARRTGTVFTPDGEQSIGSDGVLEFGDVIPGIALPLARLFP